MKKIWIAMILFLTVAAQAQIVTISINGNRNEQVIVNGVTYDIENTNAANQSKILSLVNLRPGEYTLQLVRRNDYNPNDDNMPVKDNNIIRFKTTTSFTVRPGIDLTIIVAPNGLVQVKEKPVATIATDPNTAMEDAAFTVLLKDVQYSWRNNRRLGYIQTAFTNNNNYFTTQQAIQLIQSVSDDADQLTLAKLAYSRVIDRGSFIQVYNIMQSPASKNELATLIRQAGSDVVFSYSETFRPEISDANFDALLQNIKKTADPSLTVNTVTEAFNNQSNYFTVSQARRLIETIEFEGTRLQLLKNAYQHIIDPMNFPLLYELLSTEVAKLDLITHVQTAAENGGLANYNLNKPAMSETNFTTLYTNAKNQLETGNLTSYLNNAFNDIGNYFTANQVAQLIILSDGELNRLNIAKSAYRSVIDPENYIRTMNSLFQTQAATNELSIYVYSFRKQ